MILFRSGVTGSGHGASSAGTAAGRAVSSAGGSARFPVADHSPYDEEDRGSDCQDQQNINVIIHEIPYKA